MNTVTQPLRAEHQELLPHIEQIRQVAEKIGETAASEILESVNEVYDFLAYHLKPHAQAEEAALYPVVQKVLGSPAATRTMSRDHVEIGRYIEELEALRKKLFNKELEGTEIRDLQRVLYGVYALIKVHFAKEEEVYLPFLDQNLTPASAQEMFARMEAAAHQAKDAVHIH